MLTIYVECFKENVKTAHWAARCGVIKSYPEFKHKEPLPSVRMLPSYTAHSKQCNSMGKPHVR
jgi:hypothetical protein